MKKRILAVLIAAIMILCSSVTASADGYGETGFSSPVYFESDATDLANAHPGLREYLIEKFAACEDYVPISQFQIPYTTQNWNALKELIWQDIPELFQVNMLGLKYEGQIMTHVRATFYMNSYKYNNMLAECDAAAEKLLVGIKGNDSLSEVEKALLIHDRLAYACEYDYGQGEYRYNMYGALVNGKCVCEGYTRAYSYMLNKVGIFNRACASIALNHIWNIITVDGVEYHVDVTWDDMSWNSGEKGIEGSVRHDNFLRSTKGIRATGHNTTDYYTDPTDTTYDKYYWQKVSTGFVLVGGNIYFFNGKNFLLKRIDPDQRTTLYEFQDVWTLSDNTQCADNFSVLATDGSDLFLTTSKNLYKYDIETGNVTLLYTLDIGAGYNIYGMKYDDGRFMLEACENPPGYDSSSYRVIYVDYTDPDAYTPGDINDDGEVNNKDVTTFFRYLTDIEGIVINAAAADTNGDGEINNKDLSTLFRYISAGDIVLH